MTLELDPVHAKALGSVDTCTIANALEIIDPARAIKGYTTQQFVCAYPAMAPIVGFAQTKIIRSCQPPPDTNEVVADRLHKYFDYIQAGPRPAVLVVQDLDDKPHLGAWWGEVNTAVHKRLGIQGVITNGTVRDMGVLAPDFQVLAGGIGLSHAYGRIEGYGGTVNVHGLQISHGDLIHADRHGAIIVPMDLVKQLPEAIKVVIQRERNILKVSQAEEFSFQALQAAWAELIDLRVTNRDWPGGKKFL